MSKSHPSEILIIYPKFLLMISRMVNTYRCSFASIGWKVNTEVLAEIFAGRFDCLRQRGSFCLSPRQANISQVHTLPLCTFSVASAPFSSSARTEGDRLAKTRSIHRESLQTSGVKRQHNVLVHVRINVNSYLE